GYDHFHRPTAEIVDGGPRLLPDQPAVNNFEGWTALASWGEITTRTEIGLLVTGIGYRNPDLLADMARTVDGRLILGLGSGWYEKDYHDYGYEYGSVASRMDLFEAGLARIEQRLDRLVPAPLRHIPILIGGAGERRTMPLVARHADIWHSFLDIESFRKKSQLLEQLADGVDRDHRKIDRAVQWTGADEAGEYVAEGVTLFTAVIRPDTNGYEFTEVESMLAWRRAQ
ncbi:LLM class F420-dependent oxidoreductase, partial [Mycolicibacterium smegmatis]